MQEGRPSRTAAGVAARRAAHQLLDDPLVFRDPLALEILEPHVAVALRNDASAWNKPVGRALRAFLAARSRFTEDVLADAVSRGVRQYLIVGAGYDTFAYRNPWSDLRVFEIDHPATQNAKRERLRESGLEPPPTVEFLAVDLASRPLLDALRDSTLDLSAPAVVAWLGVLPYLTSGAIEQTLQAIGSLPRGTQLVFDYGIPRSSLSFLGRIAYDRIARRVADAGEPWQSFFTPPEIEALLRQCGFAEVTDLGPTEINARYFDGRRDRLRVAEAGHLVQATVR